MNDQAKFLPHNGVTSSWEDSLILLSVAVSVSRDLAMQFFHLHYNGAENGVPHGVNGEPIDLNGWKVVDPEVVGPMKECRELHVWFCAIQRDIGEGKYRSAIQNFDTLQRAIAEALKGFEVDREARAQRMDDMLRSVLPPASIAWLEEKRRHQLAGSPDASDGERNEW